MAGLAVAGSTLFGAPAAAVLAVFGLHTSDDPLPTGGSSTPTEPAATPTRRGCGFLPRRLVWTLLLAIGGFGLVSGACLDACTGSNRIRHVPAIHGRVVDMETGQPLAGVRISRWFERVRMAGPGGAEHYALERSFRTVVTDTDGRFRFPAWYGIIRGITAVKWDEFKPGWTAGWGDLLTSSPIGFDVARGNLTRWSVRAENRLEGSAIATTFKLHRIDNPETAEDHFWALQILVRDRLLKEEDFVSEAVSYSATHEITRDLFRSFDAIAVDLGGYRDGRPCYKARLAWEMLHLEERVCSGHPDWPSCTGEGMRQVRDFLQRNCPSFER